MAEGQRKYEVIAELDDGICLAKININSLREQDINARVMDKATFDKLVSNISKRGTLEQLPYCVETDRGIEIVSGHHRSKAARVAGLEEINVLLDRSKLSRSSIAAKQLAHNAIEGVDDKDTLYKIAALITDVDDMLESAIDEEFFKQAEEQAQKMIVPQIDFEWKTVQFSFLPHQMDDIATLCDDVQKADLEGVAPLEEFDRFVEALQATSKFADVRNVGAAVHLMVEKALEVFEDDGREYDTAQSVFGRAMIPHEIAEKARKRIKQLIEDGSIDNPWEYLEIVLDRE